MSCLAEIIACFALEILDDKEHHYLLSPLWTVVSEDLARPWDLAALCHETAMSQEKLRLHCHRETGRSPMAQVTYLRMRHAAELLTSGGLNVQETAPIVGYPDPYNFSKAFKRLHGISPAHFRNKHHPAT